MSLFDEARRLTLAPRNVVGLLALQLLGTVIELFGIFTLLPVFQYIQSSGDVGSLVEQFDEWRYLDHGEPGMDNSKRPLNPDFVLNQERYQGANILLARENFGCGSSREHAPWALLDYGFQAVISTEIADIFRNNALKNGLIPVIVDQATHRWLIEHPGAELTVDLESTTLELPDGRSVSFPIDGFSRYCLMNGLDQLGFLLDNAPAIREFEQRAS